MGGLQSEHIAAVISAVFLGIAALAAALRRSRAEKAKPLTPDQERLRVIAEQMSAQHVPAELQGMFGDFKKLIERGVVALERLTDPKAPPVAVEQTGDAVEHLKDIVGEAREIRREARW